MMIPKTRNPERVENFRPISLCSVLYKVIAKTLANRLKQVMNDIISLQQNAFIKGHLISDNILIAHEIFHHLKRNYSKKSLMAVKVDMSKAYDQIEWNYLLAVMGNMGFNPSWIQWIKMCIQSVSFRILINGSPSDSVTPSRGLRQGDPLSLYLFIIYSEGLSSILDYQEQWGPLEGIRVGKHSLAISHLFFADDCLFFCKT